MAAPDTLPRAIYAEPTPSLLKFIHLPHLNQSYHCPDHLKGPVLVGFYIPMRQAEIFKLTWDKVDIGSKYIRLGQETKNKTGRVIPLHKEKIYIVDMLNS
jgi:integrase